MDYKRVGNEIRKLRKERKLTQKQLGEAIMRSESSIAKYEQGLVEIPPSVLINIADFLGVDGADLLGNIATPPPSPFSVAFKWLESLGYKVSIYEEETYRSVILRDIKTFTYYQISDEILYTLIDNIASYSRFQIMELIKNLSTNDSPPKTPQNQ